MKIVKKSPAITRLLYKRVNLFTTHVTRLISVSRQIILELIRLDPTEVMNHQKEKE